MESMSTTMQLQLSLLHLQEFLTKMKHEENYQKQHENNIILSGLHIADNASDTAAELKLSTLTGVEIIAVKDDKR